MESGSPKRRLATILAADVVGYSKLMAADEEATLHTLRAHREVTDKLIARHEGRIFNTAGDSVLAEFGSPVEAVRCAVSIQDELRVRNAELAADRQMVFRIGINVGDILVEGDDLLGDGVNVAARLESIAPPGGICISGTTFEQVKNKLSVGFQNLGPQQVKNIPEPVAAFSITSAPVSVHGTGGKQPSGLAAMSGRRKVAAAIVVAGAAAPLTSFAENTSTDELRAGDVDALMTGMTFKGNRNIDGQPFTIVLNADHTVSYEFARAGALSGTTEKITGAWRTEDFRFCMQIRQFGGGREHCPRIVKEGAKIAATQRDGTPLPWSLGK